MRLKELKYIEPGFSIEGLYFDYVSLTVGKNSVGKSRVVSVIMKLYQLILQQYNLKENDFFEYDVTFADKEIDIRYRFVCQAGEVFMEYLDDSYSHYLDRQCGMTTFYGETIYPPKNKLCVSIRRDVEKYHEAEKIVQWAEQINSFCFGQVNLSSNNSYMGIVSMYEQMNAVHRKNVIKMMHTLGYAIEDIKINEITPTLKMLFVNEKDVLCALGIDQLSTSMQKLLYIAILLNYAASEASDIKTLLIDDFCEGLDYERTLQVGSLIYEFCIKHQIQLISTTNSCFLMNVINLNYWNILTRKGGKVNALNMHNSKQMFLDFKDKGLENSKLLFS